jgi:hypothetical protein
LTWAGNYNYYLNNANSNSENNNNNNNNNNSSTNEQTTISTNNERSLFGRMISSISEELNIYLDPQYDVDDENIEGKPPTTVSTLPTTGEESDDMMSMASVQNNRFHQHNNHNRSSEFLLSRECHRGRTWHPTQQEKDNEIDYEEGKESIRNFVNQ